ncbi:MAG: acyl-CoA dehydrogenase family protein, partial [Kiloniellales bacterium]|nr:acyl-CoA dehydrogenase family protein [Kiloniellales bacterium]
MFRLSPEQQALQEKCRTLACEVIAPRAADVDRSESYPWDNVAALRDAGLVGLMIPKELGGQALGYLEAVLVIEEMAKVCGVTGRIAVETNMG